MSTILYEDTDLLVVEKPVGVSAQADANGNDSLPLRLMQQGYAVKPVHRLDRTTGGVMVYALTGKSAAALSAIVGDHTRFIKDYLAVVCGKPTEENGTWEDLLYHDARNNKSYVVKRKRQGVRHASLEYAVLQTAKDADKLYSLVRVRLHTGRTHQIRVQFASRKLPLAGDTRYGGSRDCPLALWSHRLTFPHPSKEKPIHAQSLPDIHTFPWNLFDKAHYAINKRPFLYNNTPTLQDETKQ